MGHSEMLLAVAGLNQDEIKTRTEKLAGGDWSDHPPAERLALQLGHKLSSRPASLSGRERRALVATFGPLRSVDVIWYSAWCNYMTRVADAFGLPLETTNVFDRTGKK